MKVLKKYFEKIQIFHNFIMKKKPTQKGSIAKIPYKVFCDIFLILKKIKI